VVALALLVSSGIAGARGQRHVASLSPRQLQFAAAAQEFSVPEPVLLGVSYALTRWEPGSGQADASGGYGPMHLTFLDGQSYAQTLASSGGPLRETLASIARTVDADTGLHTLDAAATLLDIPPGQVSRDPRQNIRAGAALLSSYAGPTRPVSLDGWYDAVTRYAGGGTVTPAARHVADAVFTVLRTGAQRTTSDGQRMVLAAQPGVRVGAGSGTAPAQCPAGLSCQFVAAAHADPAARPASQLRYIVLGTAGTTYEQAVARMAGPSSFTSSHYLVSDADGQVTQLVRTGDIAWYAADSTINRQAVTIALEAVGGTGYSDPTYASVAALVRYLAATYQIPLDRQHVLGRDEFPAGPAGTSSTGAASTRTAQVPRQADDPGPYWDWGRLFDLLDAPLATPSDDFGHAVAFVPSFGQNLQPTAVCSLLGLDCGALTNQPVNFVPLHTAPSDAAPLLSDPRLHPDGAPGSTDLGDLGDKVGAGQVFAVAERSGQWTAIWYGGQRGWFRDSPGLTRTVRAALVTPAPGLGSIEVYPDPAQPASGVYRIEAGQSYPLLAQLPNGFDLIRFNHQMQYVRASAVSVWPG
jgi:N-acetyl-anhydromuramyl-L-alanine amidase AmpD